MSILARLSGMVRTSAADSRTPSMESLENRTLLSVTPFLLAAGAGSSAGPTIVASTPNTQVTTIPVKIQAVVGIAYSGDVGQIKGLSPTLLPRLSATVQWGDYATLVAEKATLMFDSAGVLHVQGTHTYAKAASYAVTVNVVLAPPAGSLAPTQFYTINSSANVTQNSQGGVTIYPLLKQPFTGVVGTFTYTSVTATPVAPSFNAQIQWGDGVTSVGKVARNVDGTYSVVGTHTYAAVGTYRIVVLVTQSHIVTPVASDSAPTPILPMQTILSTAIVQQARTPIASI